MTGADLFAFVVAGMIATYMWRFAGALAASCIDAESAVFGYARAVATALVAALVVRFIYAPSGLLAQSEMWERILALSAGFAVFFVAKRNVPLGVAAAVLTLLALTQI